MLDLTGQAEGDSSVHLSQMRLVEWVLLIFVWPTEDHNERPCPYLILVYLRPEDELSSSKLQGWWLGLVVICAIRRLTTLFGIFPCSCRLCLSIIAGRTDGSMLQRGISAPVVHCAPKQVLSSKDEELNLVL